MRQLARSGARHARRPAGEPPRPPAPGAELAAPFWSRRGPRRFRGTLLAILLAAVVAVLLSLGGFRLAGGRWFVVTTPSMGRRAPVGTLIVTVATRTLAVGEIAAVRPAGLGGVVFTHQVIAAGPGDTWRTKGVLNSAPDPWTIHPNEIVGRAVLVAPGWGWVLEVVPSVALVGLATAALAGAAEPRRRRLIGVLGVEAAALAALWRLHPLVRVVEMAVRRHGARLAAAFVNTGVVPVRMSAQGVQTPAVPGGGLLVFHLTGVHGRVLFHARAALGALDVAVIALVPLALALVVAGLLGQVRPDDQPAEGGPRGSHQRPRDAVGRPAARGAPAPPGHEHRRGTGPAGARALPGRRQARKRRRDEPAPSR